MYAIDSILEGKTPELFEKWCTRRMLATKFTIYVLLHTATCITHCCTIWLDGLDQIAGLEWVLKHSTWHLAAYRPIFNHFMKQPDLVPNQAFLKFFRPIQNHICDIYLAKKFCCVELSSWGGSGCFLLSEVWGSNPAHIKQPFSSNLGALRGVWGGNRNTNPLSTAGTPVCFGQLGASSWARRCGEQNHKRPTYGCLRRNSFAKFSYIL